MTKYYHVFCGYCDYLSEYTYDHIPEWIYCKDCKGRVYEISYAEFDFPVVVSVCSEVKRGEPK